MEYKASKVNGKKYIMQENGEIIGLYLTGRKKTYGLNDTVEIKSIAIPESEEAADNSDDSLGTVNPDGTVTLGKALGSTTQLQGYIIQILGDDDSADLIVRTKDNKLYSFKTEEVHLAGVSNATFNARRSLFKSEQEWIDDLSDVCRKFDDLNRNNRIPWMKSLKFMVLCSDSGKRIMANGKTAPLRRASMRSGPNYAPPTAIS